VNPLDRSDNCEGEEVLHLFHAELTLASCLVASQKVLLKRPIDYRTRGGYLDLTASLSGLRASLVWFSLDPFQPRITMGVIDDTTAASVLVRRDHASGLA
jgi:hypothetical protein